MINYNLFFIGKIGRGSQATKLINQSTGHKIAFPSLQSSFRKQETTTNDESTSNTNTVTDDNLKKRKNAPQSDDDSDDGDMPRPSFSMNSSYENPNPNQKPNDDEIPSRSGFKQNKDIAPNKPIRSKPAPMQTKRIPDTGFIICETMSDVEKQRSISIIQTSAAKQGSIVKCDVEVCKSDATTLECIVRINGTVYGTAPITVGKKEAKILAFERALEKARKIHYTIRVSKINCLVDFKLI